MMDDSWRDWIILIVADRLDFPSQAKTALHGFEEFTHDAAVCWNLYLHALIAVEVDNRQGLAGFDEDVLCDVLRAGMAFGAETAALAVHIVRVCADGAVRGVAGKGFHDVEFVVVGEAGVGYRYWSESYLAGGCRRHGDGFALGSFQNGWW